MTKPLRVFTHKVQRSLWDLPPGKWVTIEKDRILAVGDTPMEVYEAAHQAGIETPLLYCIPDPNVGHFFSVGAP